MVRRTPKPTPEKTAREWAEEWAKEGHQIDWHKKLLPRRGFEVLPTEEVGGGENLRLVEPEQTDEQGGLREVMCHRRSVCVRCDDSAAGEAVGACLGFIGQFLSAACE